MFRFAVRRMGFWALPRDRQTSRRFRSLPVRLGLLCTGIAFCWLLSAPAFAASISLDDIQNWTGTGANRAGIVIDWKDGKGAESLAWGYRWDGAATGLDMLNAVIAADPRLYGHYGTFSFGTVYFGIGYDAQNNGFAVTPTLAFNSAGLVQGTSAQANDSRAATDSSDHYREGWNAGYWSYWTGTGTTPTWAEAQVGAADRTLSNGSWDGWSFAAGFAAFAPADAVSAPEPSSALIMLAVGAVGLATRRRRRLLKNSPAVIVLAGVAGVVGVATTTQAAYTYDPNDFAVEVVNHSGLGTFGPSPYDDPNSVLGRPTLSFNHSLNPFTPDIRRTKLIESPFNVDGAGNKLVTTLAEGSSITVRMGRDVTNDPNNPHGIDFIVFGNSFYSGTGATVSETTDLTAFTLTGSVAGEPIKVSVSPDGFTWYRYESGPYADTAFPTNAYLWDRNSLGWTNTESDPTKPVNPSLNVTGMSAADALDAYDGSAGGTGFDLAASGFSSIRFIRIEGLTGFDNGEVDAIADVRPIPEPATSALAFGAVSGLLLRRQRAA